MRLPRLPARREGDRRESLLFISPVVPATTGNGLAMRAASTLTAVATRFRVTLLVLPRYGSPAGRIVPDEIGRHCRRSAVALDPANRPFLGERFDVVHVFRLGTAPTAEPWLRAATGRSRLWLDLDDVESVVHRRLAALHRMLGDEPAATAAEAEAVAAEAREVEALTRFDRVLLASDSDRDRLPLQGAADVRQLPNVLPLPEPLGAPPDAGPAVILFVGTLGYLPNVDGALWFAREVLPEVRRLSTRAVEFQIVGNGRLPQVEALRDLPGVRVIGGVPEVRPCYERAHLVVAPLRAGGGTRIKLIEAFGLGRPVVATTVGAEGLDVVAGEHLIIADEPRAVAAACLQLFDDAGLRAGLVERARTLAGERYTPAVAARIVAGWP